MELSIPDIKTYHEIRIISTVVLSQGAENQMHKYKAILIWELHL